MGLNVNNLRRHFFFGKRYPCEAHGLEERRALKKFYVRARRRKGKEALKRLLKELE